MPYEVAFIFIKTCFYLRHIFITVIFFDDSELDK